MSSSEICKPPRVHNEFIAYVDESESNELLTYCACLCRKRDYVNLVVPTVQKTKFDLFGHDMVNFHSVDIRRNAGMFSGLSALKKGRLFERLTECVTYIAVCCRLGYFRAGRKKAIETCTKYLLERVHSHCVDRRLSGTVHVLYESAGDKDGSVTQGFEAAQGGDNWFQKSLNVELYFAPKSHNCTGMQLADLAAYPISQFVLGTMKPGIQKSFDAIRPRLRSVNGVFLGFGLKVFPQGTSEDFEIVPGWMNQDGLDEYEENQRRIKRRRDELAMSICDPTLLQQYLIIEGLE